MSKNYLVSLVKKAVGLPTKASGCCSTAETSNPSPVSESAAGCCSESAAPAKSKSSSCCGWLSIASGARCIMYKRTV